MTLAPHPERSLRDWIWAGMTTKNSGALGRPVSAGAWTVPEEVVLEGEQLRWRPGRPRTVVSEPGLLDAFLELRDGSAQEVLLFAQQWGVLRAPSGSFWLTEGYAEDIEDWRFLASHFTAVLDVAADVHLDRPPRRDRWEAISEIDFIDATVDDDAQVTYKVTLSGELLKGEMQAVGSGPQQALSAVLSEWLARAPSQLRLTWEEDPQLQLQPASLTSALVLNLVLAVAKREGLAICSECGVAFIPKRRPAAGRSSYCPRCGIKAAWRNAQRKRRRG